MSKTKVNILKANYSSRFELKKNCSRIKTIIVTLWCFFRSAHTCDAVRHVPGIIMDNIVDAVM